MKNFFRCAVASVLVAVTLSASGGALAAKTGYTDIAGHWAEGTMLRALDDTLIEGTGDRLRPDAPITGGEMLSILCAVLSAQKTADVSGISDLSKTDTYYQAAAQSVALGLVKPENGGLGLKQPVTRGKAFAVLAEAFQLIPAEPDTSALSGFSDGNTLSGIDRQAAAALVSGGYIGGVSGSLHMSGTISRAEFLTVLYNILPGYGSGAADSPPVQGGAVYSGDAVLSNQQFTGSIYFDCASTSVQLQNVAAAAVVLRGDSLSALSLASSQIGRLVFAAGGGDLVFSSDATSNVETAVVGTGGGKLTLGGLPGIEVTGGNRDLTVTGRVGTLLLSGSGNRITIAPDATVDVVRILGSGTGNSVTANGYIGRCEVYGADNKIDGAGSIGVLLDNSKSSDMTVNTLSKTVQRDYGLNQVGLELTAPGELPSYETLKASVAIKAPEGSKLCRGSWYLDNAFISQSDIDIGKTPTVSLNSDVKRSGTGPVTSTLSFILSYTSPDGIYQELRTDRSVTLLKQAKFDAADVLSTVTTGYRGNYTLAWAKAHDYDSDMKTEWVNLKGYSSKTSYLVWVNITYQRVNIFKGSAGKWVLDRTFIVGTGASGKDTPTGVFKVIGRSTKGWTTDTYTVKPVIFFINLAYGFHSRLYSPGTTKINDARIGFPVSHGCIRMYDEDVAWFYKNIPTNTTVVVY